LPDVYKQTLDPFLALTAAAAVTKRIKLATGICLVVERDPIHLAKNVATIDYLSGGRFVLGIGGGWNAEEMANHGTAFKTRFALMRERVEAMKVIWAHDEASYSGEHVSFDRIWSYPKPVQRPHPPVLIGGNGPTVLDRVLAFGDGWFPNDLRGDRVYERIEELRARADRPIAVHLVGMSAKPEAIERAAAAGVDRVIRWIPSAPRGPIEAALERWEQAIAEFNGEA
jgi:probable F420-dependent oxidoreductase